MLIFYLPAALICLSILVDWFTRKELSRPYAKLIDSSVWGAWMISMGCIALYSLQTGILWGIWGQTGRFLRHSYDALGRLVEELVGSTYTQTLYDPTGNKLALTQGQTLQKALVPLPMGGQAVYKLVSGQPALSHYRHPDWLGSARLSTTPTQTLYYDVAYAPYGENYAGSGSAVTLTFTGQTQDTVAGLYDFLYRRYNPNHGRWPMPDPAGLGAVSVENPQTWNRYAYLANDPLDGIDSLGLAGPGGGADVFGSAKPHGGFDEFDFIWMGATPQNVQGVPGNCPANLRQCWQGTGGQIFGLGPGGTWISVPRYVQVPCDSGTCPLQIDDWTPLSAGTDGAANSGPTATVGPPQAWHPAKQKSGLVKYLTEYVPCAVGEGINKFWGDSGKAGATVLANIAPLAARNLQKGGPFVALIFTAAYDFNGALSVRQQCTAEVYGGK